MQKQIKVHTKKNVNVQLHLMLVIPVIIALIYSYGPMVGLLMAFQDYVPSSRGFFYSLFKGSEWVGLDNFKYILLMPDIVPIIRNTVLIAFFKLSTKIFFPLIFALLLNEIVSQRFKKIVQSVTFLPYFLSWVILGSILLEIFSPNMGIVNVVLQKFGFKPIFFFGIPKIFPAVLVLSDLWKDIGYNTIIFLAALTSIDPGLYEAASIDGAGRFRQSLSISIPCISTIIILLSVLGIGNIMNAGFEQVFILYNPGVYSTGDIIDTYTYRMGIKGTSYSLATAVGLFKSVVSFVFLVGSNYIANKVSDYRIL